MANPPLKLPPDLIRAIMGSRRKTRLVLSQELDCGEVIYRIKEIHDSIDFVIGTRYSQAELAELLSSRPDVTVRIVRW